MKNPSSARQVMRRYERLKSQLGKLEWVLQGTITKRSDTRKPAKAPGKKRTWGPYYQWTFKRHGKTVTVNLTASQTKVYQKAIENHRKLQKTLRQMRALSLQFLEATTESVKKRKSPKSADLRLS